MATEKNKIIMMMKVADIKAACELLFNTLERLEIDEIQLRQSYYYHICPKGRYDVTKELDTNEITIGDLVDDYRDIQSYLEAPDDCLVAGFADIAPILRYIGEFSSAIFIPLDIRHEDRFPDK